VLLGLNPGRIAAWQRLAWFDPSIHELLTVHVGNQNPGTAPCREFTACLSLESIEVVIEQPR
jgi:hypothetical protein